MNKIQECVEKLLEVIREDSAYQRYLACEEMLKSNPELKKQILDAKTLVVVEDLYRPYRPKRRTRAIIAKEIGLEP